MKRRRVEQQKASNSVSYAVCCTLFSTDYSLICQKLNGKEQNATGSALAAVNYSSDCQSQQSDANEKWLFLLLRKCDFNSIPDRIAP
ncbi:Uncharacterised protein [Vibrio cholerae]|nr:Uncharacterised protein [Vibrio cholerae]